jgi:hypothetical protein
LVGGATRADVNELIAFAEVLLKDVTQWLGANHPNLLPSKRPGKK